MSQSITIKVSADSKELIRYLRDHQEDGVPFETDQPDVAGTLGKAISITLEFEPLEHQPTKRDKPAHE